MNTGSKTPQRSPIAHGPSTFVRRTGLSPAVGTPMASATAAPGAVDTQELSVSSATSNGDSISSACASEDSTPRDIEVAATKVATARHTPEDSQSGGRGALSEPVENAAPAAVTSATGNDASCKTNRRVVYDVCPTCNGRTINGVAVSSAGAKRKRQSAGRSAPVVPPAAKKQKAAAASDRSQSRARLTVGQKLEVLDLLRKKKMTKLEIAALFGCSDRTVSSCYANRAALDAEAASTARRLKAKGRRPAGFPEVDRRVLTLVNAFRKKRIPVGRATIISFAHAIRASLLASPATAAVDKEKLEKFGASDKWVKNFVSRSGLVSKPLPPEDGEVHHSQRFQENLNKIREEFKLYDLSGIYGVDEKGPLPKRSYISISETRNVISTSHTRSDGVDTEKESQVA